MLKTLYKLIFVIIFTALLAAPTLLPAAENPPLPDPIGRVVWVSGTLKAIMPNKEIRTLQKTSLIYLNDTLTTDDKSTAEIAFTDNSLMTFRPNTQFRIDQYSYQPKKKGVGKYITTLMQGGFRTITGAIAKENPSDYRVNTPVATIGVRGTDYEAAIDNNGELAIAYYEGKPCVTANAKTLCLDNETPFATVPQQVNAVPVAQKTAPIILKEKSVITPAKIEPFVMPESFAPGSGSGPISSFCISQ